MAASCLFTFRSTHHALKAEKWLLANGVRVTVLPVPKEIDSTCGIALAVRLEERSRAEGLLATGKAAPEAVYEWTRK